jgi:hydroxymethylpyrimidine/phosphomethylpyrimidine kinase
MTTSPQSNSDISPTKKAVLSIAGFDPTSGAGILVDSAVFRALGLHPLAVLTSVAAQGATSVRQTVPLPESFIRDELEIINAEFQPGAIKIGMLLSVEAVRTVSRFIQKLTVPIVLDPVITASSGGNLIDEKALSELEDTLIPRCTIITPNIPEARHFLGREIATVGELETAALELSSRWGCAVLLKSGHLKDTPVDIMANQEELTKYAHTRAATSDKIRGTGCILSSALTGFLARDYDLGKAAENAIDFTVSLIRIGYSSGMIPDVSFPDITST